MTHVSLSILRLTNVTDGITARCLLLPVSDCLWGRGTMTGCGEDFSGNYVAGEAGIALTGGPSDVIMKNEHGVVLIPHGTQQGVPLTLAAQGVSLKLKS